MFCACGRAFCALPFCGFQSSEPSFCALVFYAPRSSESRFSAPVACGLWFCARSCELPSCALLFCGLWFSALLSSELPSCALLSCGLWFSALLSCELLFSALLFYAVFPADALSAWITLTVSGGVIANTYLIPHNTSIGRISWFVQSGNSLLSAGRTRRWPICAPLVSSDR